MSWYNVGAAAITVGGQLLKPKQKAPALSDPINLNDQAKQAVKGNTENENSIEALLTRANSFNADQNISLMEKAMPGYGALSKKLTSTANNLLTDPYSLPKDVEDNIARLAAERGISAGTKGEFNDFSLLRDFGINSLQFGQQRIGQAQGITGLLASIAPKVNPLSPMSFYVTPQQSADVAAGNRSYQQASNNANTAAANLNNDNSWAAIMQGAGSLWDAYATRKPNTGGSGANLVPSGAPQSEPDRFS